MPAHSSTHCAAPPDPSTPRSMSERIATVEQQQKETNRRLGAIEGKIDRFLFGALAAVAGGLVSVCLLIWKYILGHLK